MVEWMELGIKPSSYISSLCYSVLRLEPFTGCSFGCTYCYARWYRGAGPPWAKPWLPRVFEKIARRMQELPRPVFRLATLSDPLQQRGGAVPGVVKALLRTALRYRVPLVLNTRGDVAGDPEVFALLLSLAEHRLVLVQVTLGLPEGPAQLLEPGAPPPSRRLDSIEALARHGVPVVVRVQPLVPGLEEWHLRAATEALERGARGLIAEPLRETQRGLEALYKLLGAGVPSAGWEGYQLGEEPGREPLLHPGPAWRERMHMALEALAQRYGAVYAPCKDALLPRLAHWYRPGRSCCLEWLAVEEPVLVRPTLHEYVYWLEQGGDGSWQGFNGYICSLPVFEPFCSMLDYYPSPVRKALRAHHRRLQRLVENRSKLEALLSKTTMWR
ncbi:SPL family radical SAM protein [Pyrodictium delaneyi]|uniref:SPL family radical SAM protein n=1 Tax=Pyrodictium delaneyi TaxID=1273541 RepID=UPI00117A27DB|nr:radical SAM protein [Pyrodictium delaneyi]